MDKNDFAIQVIRSLSTPCDYGNWCSE
jgi:hypothetical protein